MVGSNIIMRIQNDLAVRARAVSLLLCCLFLCALPVKSQDAINPVMQYRAADGQYRPVKTKKDWQLKKKQVLQAMQEVMGPLPVKPSWVPVITYTDTLYTDHYTRYTVALKVEAGESVPALLYLPRAQAPSTHKYPAALVLHGTGEKGKHLVDSFSAAPNRAIATELVHRGYIVLAPDYPGFGDLADHDFAKDRYASGTMQGIFNHIRCIDYLQSRKDVYKDKIGVIGHSLGGHNAIFLGAFDERAKVVVASCGWTLMQYYNAGQAVTERYGGKLGAWAQDRYMPYIRERYQLDPAKLPFDFNGIIATLAPRYFFSNSPLKDGNFDVKGVEAGMQQVSAVYHLLNVPDRLSVAYPDAGHDFPAEARKEAYQLMDGALHK